jgi:hypothetical protein
LQPVPEKRWRTSPIDPIGLQRRRRNILEVSGHEFLRAEPVLTLIADRNPKAFSFANPGRLAKSAARSHDVGLLYSIIQALLTLVPDQREATPCPSS